MSTLKFNVFLIFCLIKNLKSFVFKKNQICIHQYLKQEKPNSFEQFLKQKFVT